MGFCSRFSNVAVALLASTLLKETVSQLTECSPSSSAGFDYEVTVGTDFDIRWSVDTAAETISFEASTTAESWVSVGFSSDGEMVGSDAVIGLPDDSDVSEYSLMAKAVDEVVLYEEQEITNAAISQETDLTTISFTRPLAPSTSDKEILSATPGDETWLIYAFGVDNELENHGNENRGSVLLDLFCGDVDGGDNFTGSPTPAPSSSGAYRVSGGLFATAATVTAAVLGAAMAA